MYITETYKYKKDGIIYVSGQMPEDAEILETMEILNAEEGLTLFKNGEEVGSSIWLKEGDSQENYEER